MYSNASEFEDMLNLLTGRIGHHDMIVKTYEGGDEDDQSYAKTARFTTLVNPSDLESINDEVSGKRRKEDKLQEELLGME